MCGPDGRLARNGNPLRLGRLALGQPQLEPPIFIRRLRLLLIHRGRQHEGALEGALGPFYPVIVL